MLEKNLTILNKNLAPIIAVVIVVFLTLIVFRPTLANTLQLQGENKKSKNEVAILTDKIQKIEAIDENEIKRRTDLVEEVFPSKKPVLDLLNALEQLSTEKNVFFGGIELKPGKLGEGEKTGRQDFEISFTIEGELASISSFVNELEKTPPLMKIETMDLKLRSLEEGEQKEETGTQRWSRVTLGVRVFYQPPPKTIGSVDQPLPILSQDETEILQKISNYRIFPKTQTTAPTGKTDLFTLP